MSRMKNRFLCGVVGLGLLGPTSAAFADPFAHVSIVARPAGSSGSFVSSITPVQGQSYDYEVLVSMGGVGATNPNFSGNATHSITALSSGGTAGTPSSYTYNVDGISSLKFNLIESDPSSPLRIDLSQAGTLNTNPTPTAGASSGTSWGIGTGASGGVPTSRANGGNDLIGIRPVHAAGIFTAAEGSEVLMTGTFTIASAPDSFAPVSLTGQWASGGLGGGKVNNGASQFFPSGTTESGANPYVQFTPLTFAAVPEPASLGLLGVATIGLLARRRHA